MNAFLSSSVSDISPILVCQHHITAGFLGLEMVKIVQIGWGWGSGHKNNQFGIFYWTITQSEGNEVLENEYRKYHKKIWWKIWPVTHANNLGLFNGYFFQTLCEHSAPSIGKKILSQNIWIKLQKSEENYSYWNSKQFPKQFLFILILLSL